MSAILRRILQIDTLIRSGDHPSVHKLMARFEVSRRTVYSDIDYFRNELRAPIAYSRANGGYYYTDATWSLPSVITTQGELLAFFLSAELVRRYLGTSFEEPLRSAIAKFSQALPTKLQVDLGQLAQHFTFQPGAIASADPLLLVELNQAINEHWRIDMVYFTGSTGERNQRTIEPYHLYNVRGDWQVIGFDHLRQKFRNFAVSRIETWSVLRHERFRRDASFSPAAYLALGFLAERGDTPTEVVIWFDPHQARYVREREWHPSQQIEEHADGSLTLRFQTGALDEVRRWLMSYGSHMRVLAPASLAAQVAEEARAMLRNHESR